MTTTRACDLTADAWRSTLHPLARRIVERPQRHAGRHALAGDLHFVAAGGNPRGIRRPVAPGDVAETERRADRVREHPRADAPDQLAVSPDRLVVVQESIVPLESQRHQAAAHTRGALREQRLAADEAARLVPGDGELQPRLERGVLVRDVVAPVAVGLFDAQ